MDHSLERRCPRRALSVARAILPFLIVACGASTPGSPPTPAGPFVRPAVQRVILVILENETSSNALNEPFMRELAGRGALLSNYHALTHPSQPNYIALASGSTHGVSNDTPVDLDVRHLGDLLDENKLEWTVYAEGYPGGCFLGASSKRRGEGTYVRRHVPFMEFNDVTRNAARCNLRVVSGARFDDDVRMGHLPAFSLYVPDNDHNGHDTGVAVADRWLKSKFATLLSDPSFMKGTLFIVTFDEGTRLGGNVIYTALIGPMVKPGVRNGTLYTHYSLLRTIEEVLGTGTLGLEDAKAQPISDIWQ